MYRRYAGLFFCVCVDANDNELAYLEAIHLFVEVLGVSCCLCYPRSPNLVPSRFILRQRLRVGPCVQLLQGMSIAPECHYPLTAPCQVYAILDEVFLAGEIEETSKDVVLARLEELEKLE